MFEAGDTVLGLVEAIPWKYVRLDLFNVVSTSLGALGGCIIFADIGYSDYTIYVHLNDNVKYYDVQDKFKRNVILFSNEMSLQEILSKIYHRRDQILLRMEMDLDIGKIGIDKAFEDYDKMEDSFDEAITKAKQNYEEICGHTKRI